MTDNPFRTPKLLVFSAADEGGPIRIASQYQNHLAKLLKEDIDKAAYIQDAAYTLDTCRSLLPWRSYVVLDSFLGIDSLVDRLSVPVTKKACLPSLGFIFTGQGAQWHAMGRGLLEYPIYRESVEVAAAFLCSLGCSWSALSKKSQSTICLMS